jgi:hypothetical protein
MTTATAWSHKIDGTELNDPANGYGTNVPEAEHGFGATVLLTEMQARTPVFNRQQPIEGKFTFLTWIFFDWDKPEDYQTLLTALKVLYGPGAHTYEYTAPGQTSSQSTTVYFDGPAAVDSDGFAVTARAIAPNPVFA